MNFYREVLNSKNLEKIIDLPPELRNTDVEVIVLPALDTHGWKSDREEANAPRRTDLLSLISIDTRGWKFDKEEANER